MPSTNTFSFPGFNAVQNESSSLFVNTTRPIRLGEWTLNEVRRGCLMAVFFLMAGANKDLYFDLHHWQQYL